MLLNGSETHLSLRECHHPDGLVVGMAREDWGCSANETED